VVAQRYSGHCYQLEQFQLAEQALLAGAESVAAGLRRAASSGAFR